MPISSSFQLHVDYTASIAIVPEHLNKCAAHRQRNQLRAALHTIAAEATLPQYAATNVVLFPQYAVGTKAFLLSEYMYVIIKLL